MPVTGQIPLSRPGAPFPTTQPTLGPCAPVRRVVPVVFSPFVLSQQKPIGRLRVHLRHHQMPWSMVNGVQVFSVSVVPGFVVAVVLVPFVDNTVVFVGIMDREGIVSCREREGRVGGGGRGGDGRSRGIGVVVGGIALVGR